jgi:hypothetical protein
MILHDVAHDGSRRPPISATSHVYPTISGIEGSCLGAEFTLWTGMLTGGMGDIAGVKYDAVYTGMAVVVSGREDCGEYEPEMVRRLLQLDAKAPEAKFNNVIDMMDWLNSD